MFSFFDLVFYGCFVHFVAMRDERLAHGLIESLIMKKTSACGGKYEKKHRNVFGYRVLDADGLVGCW